LTASRIDEETLRRMKALGLSDDLIGEAFGVNGSVVKKLRKVFGVAGLHRTSRSSRKGRPKAATLNGWPKVLSPEARDKRWAKYFAALGRDHGDDEVRVRPAGRALCRGDISHMHALGGSSLNF
jgi:hypothetical protein